MFPSIHCKMNTPEVYLTFDDGPHPVATPTVLNILHRFNIKATFFFLGKNILQYPDIVRDVAAAGHSIGNHGFSHSRTTFKHQSYIQKEITDTSAALQSVAGRPTTMFVRRTAIFHVRYCAPPILHTIDRFYGHAIHRIGRFPTNQ